ncbi:hypothetical protein [Streptomyces sp. 7N604]|uniref:hypothetical protein n=1 Tax=Streptomyces sp. 7N604 TaxID=3457415 RepID=UPI003FD4C41E
MTELVTTAEDVLRQFCISPGTQKIFENWRRDPRRRNVAPVVLEHRARLIYTLVPTDVESVCRRTEHALGEVRRADGEAVRAIVDWHPDFAFTHMLHVCMEQRSSLPTYQEFREFADRDSLGKQMLGIPAREKVREVVAAEIPATLARAAMRWRVGNAYYSFLREVYTVVNLRSRGVDLRVHPLADALFRVDAWVGRKALSLRVGNKKFREGERDGRKTPPEQLLADVTPRFEFESIELSPATEFGRVHLPSYRHLESAAALLNPGTG